ncbi:MAG: response regulator transcription factor [Caldilinea sp.]|nr:response regulator transcription factor [Caldilineaceae bacterium]MCB9117555.1 response regulator transcription factor [Caldilineaceae bacterium]MCB9122332.1 response regulator transcription factor [Caldilineaceae bacterium]MCO5209870.1 response regulator transcription factor [Caldilinea sp.]MCW5844089.1 response regulator transcription factor [Caldilinea sp.]
MRLLLVEDDHKIAGYVKRGLEEEGYAVDAAYDGRDGLDWALAAPYDLFILDVMLPGLDGFSLCRELRRQGIHAPVLMLTARDAVDDRVDGLDAGADDYLVKPFAFRELLARLRALLRRAADAPKRTVLQAGDLTLDTRTQRVQRGERTIELTAKEFAVLECMMRDPGRVLSRTVIADHVWSYDAYNQSNVIDVYIRNLRRKIDDDSERKLIETVRGVGYRVTVDDAATA